MSGKLSQYILLIFIINNKISNDIVNILSIFHIIRKNQKQRNGDDFMILLFTKDTRNDTF